MAKSRRYGLLSQILMTVAALASCGPAPDGPVQPPKPNGFTTATPLQLTPLTDGTTDDPLPTPPLLTKRELLEKGAEMQQEDRVVDALAYWRWALVAAIPGWRGLDFKHPVPAQFMTRDALRSRMRFELEKEYPGATLGNAQSAGHLLGFYPAGFDLKQLLIDLYTEQVAGFYDPDLKELFLIGEAKAKDRNLLELLLAGDGTQEQYLTLAHEVQHALADQHFDLYAMHAAVKADDDMALALSALIEGEAMAVMMLPALPNVDRLPFLVMDNDLISKVLDFILPLAAFFSASDAYRRAPLVVKETLLLPYTKGMSFVLSLTRKSGAIRLRDAFAPVDQAFRDPPTSTEQVLHPEKYQHPRDEPVHVQWSERVHEAGQFALVYSNTVGELQLGLLLRGTLGDDRALAAAAGWDGDRYELRRSGETLRLYWAFQMDSPADASDLAAALKAHYSTLASRRARPRASIRVDQTRVGLVLADDVGPEHIDQWFASVTTRPKRFQPNGARAQRAFPDSPDAAILRFQALNPYVDTVDVFGDESTEVKRLRAFSRRTVGQACGCTTVKCVGTYAGHLRDLLKQKRADGLALSQDAKRQFAADAEVIAECLERLTGAQPRP